MNAVALLSLLGFGFLFTGYALVALFMVAERLLRQTGAAKTLSRSDSDRGSTLIIGASFGLGLLFPVFTDLVLRIGLFSINFIEGLGGLAILAGGLGLRIWAARTLGKYYTRTLITSAHQEVISTGPYSKIRHPGYLGGLLLWSGFGVLTSNMILVVVFPIMFVIAYLYRINVEERMLSSKLGVDYEEYQKRTRRLLPFVY